MLKIKDRVSLTELEKFGFENGSKSYLLICDGEILCVDKQYRNIFIQCENRIVVFVVFENIIIEICVHNQFVIIFKYQIIQCT